MPGFISGIICGLYAHVENVVNSQPAAGFLPPVALTLFMLFWGTDWNIFPHGMNFLPQRFNLNLNLRAMVGDFSQDLEQKPNKKYGDAYKDHVEGDNEYLAHAKRVEYHYSLLQ